MSTPRASQKNDTENRNCLTLNQSEQSERSINNQLSDETARFNGMRQGRRRNRNLFIRELGKQDRRNLLELTGSQLAGRLVRRFGAEPFPTDQVQLVVDQPLGRPRDDCLVNIIQSPPWSLSWIIQAEYAAFVDMNF